VPFRNQLKGCNAVVELPAEMQISGRGTLAFIKSVDAQENQLVAVICVFLLS
jgi:hypothetical protein